MTVFVVAFGLNLHSLAQKQSERDRIDDQHRILKLRDTLQIMNAPNTVAGGQPQELKKRTDSAANGMISGDGMQ